MSYRPKWWVKFVAAVWPASRIGGRALALPVVGRALALMTMPLFSPKRQSLSYIPINQEVTGAGSMFLPREIVAGLIKQASHRAIIRECTCRLDRGCTEHDVAVGCLLMGDGAAEIDENIARHVSVPEALAHLDRALTNGLMPLVGRAPIDNYIWGVKNRGRLLTVCFCCRCCCTILGAGRHLPGMIHGSIVPPEGVAIHLHRELCTGCGACVRECFMGALSLVDGVAVRDAARCKGCGRCAAVCSAGAVTISVDADKARSGIVSRIRGYVDFE